MPDGSWGYGRTHSIDRSSFRSHFKGKTTLAPSCLDKSGRALFVVFDVDRRFYERLSIFATVLRRRGLERAAFATEGSDDGSDRNLCRGKIVLTLAEPMPQVQAQGLASSIIEEARADILFGLEESPHEISVFPRGGSPQGNVVRLFGTNKSRTAAVGEASLDLDGWVSDLPYLEPASFTTISPGRDSGEEQTGTTKRTGKSQGSSFTTIPPGRESGEEHPDKRTARIATLLVQPYTGTGATIAGDMLALAHDVRRSGVENPAAALEAILDKLVLRSPNMTRGARENVLRKKAQEKALDLAFSVTTIPTADELGAWRPLPAEQLALVGCGARKAYTSATNLLVSLRRDPHVFSIGYRQWALLAGYSEPSVCRHAVDDAEKHGLLFRIDRGTQGLGGLSTMVAFVGDGETLQSAYDDALTTDTFQARLAQRKERDLPPPVHFVENGVPIYQRAA